MQQQAKLELDQRKREAAGKARELVTEIFSVFRKARTDEGDPFEALQNKIAEHAGDLVELDLCNMKDIQDMLIKLNGVAKDEADKGESNEAALQKFLRKSEVSEEGTVQ